MQEPLYSLSWQATIRPGKRVSLAPRFYREPTKESGARPPSLFGSVRGIFLSGYAALCLLLVTARLENLKFRSFENNKTRTLLCTGLKIHILWACEKPRKGNDLNYTPIAGKNNRPSENLIDGEFNPPIPIKPDVRGFFYYFCSTETSTLLSVITQYAR